MQYKCLHFNELSLEELYAIMKVRQEVFVVEQDCAYVDADDIDKQSWHVMGYMESDLVAYARIVPKGLSYPDYPSIGRVLVAQPARRKGTGFKLMEQTANF